MSDAGAAAARSRDDERLDAALSELSAALGRTPGDSHAGLDSASPNDNIDRARALYRARRTRSSAFGDDAVVFAEPAWDMLLDLYVAKHEQRTVSVCNAAIGACASITTGLRWIGVLKKRGLINEAPHPSDRRVRLVAITDRALLAMDTYLGHHSIRGTHMP